VCEHVFVRWDNLSVDLEDPQRPIPKLGDGAVVRTFDAPQALGIRFHEIQAKSALNKVHPAARMPFNWTVNPYRGCSHACTYCFARRTHVYLGLDAGRDFEREIVVKVNVPERLRAELGRPSWKREGVALGTNTDPYQWVECRYKLMPGIWQALLDHDTPGSLVSKSPLALRDLEHLRALASGPGFQAFMSVPTLDERAWRETEPHTPSPRARLEAVRKMNEAGVPAGVLIAPLMPGINDTPEEVAEIVRLADEAGATSVGAVALHLRGEVKDVFFEWLAERRPELLDRYRELYAKGAYAPGEERRRLQALARIPRRPRGRKPAPSRGPQAKRETARKAAPKATEPKQRTLF
jgi:DNA repair photolyase